MGEVVEEKELSRKVMSFQCCSFTKSGSYISVNFVIEYNCGLCSVITPRRFSTTELK